MKKIKINWGVGIVIAIVCFMSFILYFVFTMNTKTYRHDLVSKQYYQKELEFQKQINATKNALELKQNIIVLKTKKGLQIEFPESFSPKKIKGKVFLYRPSNKQLDFEFPISLSDSYLLVPAKRLLGGRWNISVSWQYIDKGYYYEKKIVY